MLIERRGGRGGGGWKGGKRGGGGEVGVTGGLGSSMAWIRVFPVSLSPPASPLSLDAAYFPKIAVE